MSAAPDPRTPPISAGSGDPDARRSRITSGAAEHIAGLLRDIQQALYDRAKKFRDERVVTANTHDEFRALFPAEKDDFARAYCPPHTAAARARAHVWPLLAPRPCEGGSTSIASP